MIARLACLALLAALQAEEPKKSKHPPCVVIVTAKTRFARWKESYQEFKDRVRKVMPHAELYSREQVPNDNAGWERWRFHVSADSKLDITLFPRIFGDMKVGRYELEITGTVTQDPQTKAIFLTSYGGKVKVKLMNRPKKVGEEAEDKVAKVLEAMNSGDKPYFTLRGEVFSHGGTFAILVETFQAAKPPVDEEETKKK